MGKCHPLIPPALLGWAVASSCPPTAPGTWAGTGLCLRSFFLPCKQKKSWALLPLYRGESGWRNHLLCSAYSPGSLLFLYPGARTGVQHCWSRSPALPDGEHVLWTPFGHWSQPFTSMTGLSYQCSVLTPVLLPIQSSRIDDQRCAPPDSIPRGPTMPDEDFFSLIQRVQAKRMDEQRVDLASAQEEAAEEQQRPGSS